MTAPAARVTGRGIRAIPLLLLALSALLLRAAAPAAAVHEFDLPAGEAAIVLRLFSTQAGRGLIADAELLRGVRTNAVRGSYDAHEALRRLLSGTQLIAQEDTRSGAFVIVRAMSPIIAGKAGEAAGAARRPLDTAPPAPADGNRRPPGRLRGWFGQSRATAHERPGHTISVLAGRVLNQGTGLYLEGARVEVIGIAPPAYTARDGSFEVRGVPAGRQTVFVSYAGLNSHTASIVVREGRTGLAEIALTADTYVLERFVVPGEREGNALALTQQRNAPNIKNVLAADAFGNVADENLGNFLQRLPGIAMDEQEGSKVFLKVRGISPDLNAVAIDGTRVPSGGLRAGLNRRFEVDTIPADFIETIEVTKAPTPDMDADSIGGNVNLRTKSALDRKGRTVTYRIGTSYTLNGNTFSPTLNFMFSDRLGRDRRVGLMFTTSFNESSRARDVSLINGWERTAAMDRPVYFYLTSHGEDAFDYTRYGAGLRLDYRATDDLSLHINTMYAFHTTWARRRRAVFSGVQNRVAVRVDAGGLGRDASNEVASILPGFSGPPGSGTVTETIGHGFQFNQFERERELESWNVQFGGTRRFAAGALDFNFTYAPSHGRVDLRQAQPSVSGVGFRFDRSAPRRGKIAHWTQISGPDVRDPANRAFSSYTFNQDALDDRMLGAQVNLRRDVAIADSAYFKTGLRFRSQKPEQDFRRSIYAYTGPSLARFIAAGSAAPVNPGLVFMDLPTVHREFQSAPQFFVENPAARLQSRLSSDKAAAEDVTALYVMGAVRAGRLGILAGVRAEQTHVHVRGNVRQLTPGEQARRAAWPGPVTVEESLRRVQAEYGNIRDASGRYRDVFPGIHLRYEPRDGLVARASWSTSIGRPNFATIIPDDAVDHENEIVAASNPGLRPQYAHNFDLAVEYYFEPMGLLAVGTFQKRITDFIQTTTVGRIRDGHDNGFGGAYAGYELRTQLNGGYARVRGLEFTYQQQFSRLPGIWSRFGIFANHTWLDATGDYGNIGQVVRRGQLPGFESRLGNLGLTYTTPRLSVRLQRTYTGPSMQELDPDPTSQRYSRSVKPTDLHASYVVSPRWRVFLDVINVFNDPLVHTYIFHPSRPRNDDGWKPVFKVGVSGRL